MYKCVNIHVVYTVINFVFIVSSTKYLEKKEVNITLLKQIATVIANIKIITDITPIIETPKINETVMTIGTERNILTNISHDTFFKITLNILHPLKNRNKPLLYHFPMKYIQKNTS